jgi:hypothetical protein
VQTALGFRTHSGWAALVAIGLSAQEPVVCDRRVIVLADPEIRGSKQPYHSAEPMAMARAKEFLKRCTDSTYKLAVAGVTAAITELKRNEHEVVTCGMLTGSGRMPGSVEAILASHPAIHTAEGELYRDAIGHACDRCKLLLVRIREKDALEWAAVALRTSRVAINSRMSALGKSVGPPWAQDQKLAALAAWVALTEIAGAQRRKAAGPTA